MYTYRTRIWSNTTKFQTPLLGLPFDEQILINEVGYMQNTGNKKRIITRGDLLCRYYYNDLGEVGHSKVPPLGKLPKVLVKSLHGTAGKHPGISKKIQKIQQNE